MKIYVSGPPVKELEEGRTLHGLIYRTIIKVVEKGGQHQVVLPIRTAELDRLSARDFVAAMAKRIADAERVMTVFDKGDQSTPVEATIAALGGKPQFVLEITAAPRLIRGLPGIVGGVTVSAEKLESQIEEALEKLVTASHAASPTPKAA